MHTSPHDPRAVANLILDFADEANLPVRHIALQKLLYFAHESFLLQQRRPLVTGAFEAWPYGPVQPATYHAFKAAGEDAIVFRASAADLLTGELVHLTPPQCPTVRLHIMRILASYGAMSSSQLVRLSHRIGGPWHAAVSREGGIANGARISDDLILKSFSSPIRVLNSDQRDDPSQEPTNEIAPIADYGSG